MDDKLKKLLLKDFSLDVDYIVLRTWLEWLRHETAFLIVLLVKNFTYMFLSSFFMELDIAIKTGEMMMLFENVILAVATKNFLVLCSQEDPTH